jgi:hypothetical protein
MFNNFFFDNRTVFEIMSKIMVEPEGMQCWISKATCTHAHALANWTEQTHVRARTHTHTHTHKYVILIAFSREQ